MNPFLRHGLAAGLVTSLFAIVGTGAAQAQSGAYVFQGPDGPTVLQVDVANRPIVPPQRPDLAVPAIAVPQVMNGGGFGITGFNYYDSGLMEGRADPRAKRRYVLAPAWIPGYGQH